MRKNLFTKLVAGLSVLAITQSYAGDNYWKNFYGKEAPSRLPMTVTPGDYKIFTLDQNAMRDFLFNLDTDYDKAKQITLPTPDRKYRTFHVWKTPAMEPGLAEKYPEIQTFTAVADDDPNVTAKIEYTVFGFTALVIDGDKSFLIDPYSNDPDGYYVAFYRNDYQPVNIPNGVCEVKPAITPSDNGIPTTVEPKNKTAAKVNGSLRHVYRLALSCTGEYAIAVVGANPTKPQVLSKMVTTVDRVNAFYERELSVSMVLIANNDAIVYTNPGLDPYNCNSNLGCLIGEVQTNITSVIGPVNYDIGHIVCTAGGGLAQLSAVCGGGKASGTSSSGGPDDFSVILHEMGHQFGSNHTFSANSGGCNGNGNEGTAYEPGGGNSIMSYAGLCAPNNVGEWGQYFHVSSFNEIGNFLTTQGSTCGTTNSGLAPVVLPSIKDSFNIPVNTPFELTAPAATATPSGASVSYSWEQYDLGNFGGTEAQNGQSDEGPLMRSYPPTTNKLRSYPTIPRIIDGTYTAPGERLPLTSRTVRFKLTARSVYQGWGTFNFIDSVVRLKVGGGSFRVTSQSSATTWDPNTDDSIQTVEWNPGGTTNAPINCGYVNIYLSLDDGATFPFLMVANAPNTGSYDVKVPDLFTTTGRIKVKGTGNVFFDINKGPITINGNPNGIDELELAENLAFYPNPATDRIHVMTKKQWNGALSAVMYNAVGQKVWSGAINNGAEIRVGGFARGNYLIQVVDGVKGTRTTHKVVLR